MLTNAQLNNPYWHSAVYKATRSRNSTGSACPNKNYQKPESRNFHKRPQRRPTCRSLDHYSKTNKCIMYTGSIQYSILYIVERMVLLNKYQGTIGKGILVGYLSRCATIVHTGIRKRISMSCFTVRMLPVVMPSTHCQAVRNHRFQSRKQVAPTDTSVSPTI